LPARSDTNSLVSFTSERGSTLFMKWWKDFWGDSPKQESAGTGSVRLLLPGWTEDTTANDMRVWRDADGDVLSVAGIEEPFQNFDRADEMKVKEWCRDLAKSRDGGLIEAHKSDDGFNFIYKRLQVPAYVYTGMVLARVRETWLIWTTVAGERGTTGVREAVVTATLLNEGKIKPEEYESRWAQDPYEPAYRKVDRSVLRFISDDESYDSQFPQHPLSKVRRILALLPISVEYDFPSA
jgi:hypothetical protein